MKYRKGKFFIPISLLVITGIAGVAATISFLVPSKETYSQKAAVAEEKETLEKVPKVLHVSTPESVKAIYMSQCVVGTPSFREKLVALVDTTELNSIVIDIKDYTGKIAFTTENPILKDSVSTQCGAADMEAFIKKLHEKNIYVIGRITVFQDPYYTKKHPEQAVKSRATGAPWKDHKGLSFIDVSSRAYWDYVVELSKESYAIGFDELNYDYIRYPSDGPMKDAVYVNPNKEDALETFWKFLYEEVKPIGVVTSADLFGMTTTNTDDLNIGQVLERAYPYFDFIAPMVYPSHYPPGFHGLSNPNKNVYAVIHFSMGEAVRRALATSTTVKAFSHTPIASTASTSSPQASPQLYQKPVYDKLKLRPWLQDFDYGGTYGPAEIQAQIKATYDVGLNSYMFWDPANRYDSLRQVVKKEN